MGVKIPSSAGRHGSGMEFGNRRWDLNHGKRGGPSWGRPGGLRRDGQALGREQAGEELQMGCGGAEPQQRK